MKAPALSFYLELIEQRDLIDQIKTRYQSASNKSLTIDAQAIINIDGQEIKNPAINRGLARALTSNAVAVLQQAINDIDARIASAQSAAQAEYDALFNPPP